MRAVKSSRINILKVVINNYIIITSCVMNFLTT